MLWGIQSTKEKKGHPSKLSTVNCQLSPSNTPQQLPGDVPWKSALCLPVNIWENIIFRQFYKGHYFSRSGFASIS